MEREGETIMPMGDDQTPWCSDCGISSLFAQHPLQGVLHHEPTAIVTHKCPHCDWTRTGNVRDVLEAFQEHAYNAHLEILEECGCCGCYHFPEFRGDCREDWERF